MSSTVTLEAPPTDWQERVLALLANPPANTRITILDPAGNGYLPGLGPTDLSVDAGYFADTVLLQWIADAGATRCLHMSSLDGEAYLLFHSEPAHAEPYLTAWDCFTPGQAPRLHDLTTGAVSDILVDGVHARQRALRQQRCRAALTSRWRLRTGRPVIYYAHSMRCYNTPKEEAELAAIRRRFPRATIVNPALFEHDGHAMTMFLRAVARADMTIFSTYEEHLGRGVYLEVARALALHKPVCQVTESGVTPWQGTFRILNEDWAVQFAVPVMAGAK